jgi:hypothetical protein
MLLLFEITAGVLLAWFLWRLPKVSRCRKLRNWYLSLSSSEVTLEAKKSEMYTNDQIILLIRLSLAQTQANRESIASELADSSKP